MKKTTLIISALLLYMASPAATLHILDGIEIGGYMPECISPDGTYIGGSTQPMAMFVGEWQNNDIFLVTTSEGSAFENYGAEIISVNNSGIGVGFDDNGAVMVDLKTRSYSIIERTNPGKDIYDAIADAITEDGATIAGMVEGANLEPSPVYWENGKLNYLPVPSDEELGFKTAGSRARFMSQDGSVIVGTMVDRFSTRPMVIWNRQADGSYLCNPVCAKYFGDDNEFVWFEPKGLSPDGSKVAMQLMYATEGPEAPLFEKMFLGIYDVTTDNLTVIKPDGENGIEFGQTLNMFSHCISNNGTVVGWIVTDMADRLAFIKPAGESQPKLLSEVYPEVDKLLEYDEIGEHALSGISADGRYICGMGVNADYEIAIYEGYVLDTGAADAGIENIVQQPEDGTYRVYNLQGVKVMETKDLSLLNSLPQGIYLINGKKVLL